MNAKTAAMNDAVGSLLGSRPGLALRRALSDVDSTDLAARLVSKEGRPLRHAAALALSEGLSASWQARRAAAREEGDAQHTSSATVTIVSDDTAAAAEGVPATTESVRPVSEAAMQLRELQAKRRAKVVALLLKSHLSRQMQQGVRGAVALASFAYLAARIAVGALRQSALRSLRARLSGAGREGIDGPVPMASPAAAQ